MTLVLADADCRVLYYKTGLQGAANDSACWTMTDFNQALQRKELNVPEEPAGFVNYHLIGDNGFPLNEKLVVPFLNMSPTGVERHFNYR